MIYDVNPKFWIADEISGNFHPLNKRFVRP